jgi:RNA polymerase sigma factor (sigma-70 family)
MRLETRFHGEDFMRTAAISDLIGETLDQDFEELFREHHQLVCRAAYSITGRVEDAEDVLQMLFVKLMQRGLPPGFHQNPKGYLYRAAVNASLDLVQARTRRSAVEAATALSPGDSPGSSGPSSFDERENLFVDRLRRALTKLKPRAVEILILHYKFDYTDAQIAKMLGTARGAVAINLFRSRARLKRLLRAV